MIKDIDELNAFLLKVPFSVNIYQPLMSEHLEGIDEPISCILWSHDNKCNFFMTGLDVIKILVFKFNLIGRPVVNRKKFAEGIYSDLRHYDYILEPSKSEFLQFLFKQSCIRSTKKQRIYYWEKVDHNCLFLNALRRDLTRDDPATIPSSTYQPELIISKIF